MTLDGYQQILENYERLAYLALFFVSTLESLAVVGLLVPGTTITVIFGLMAADGEFDLRILMIACALGAMLGDGLSYYLGRRGTHVVWRGKELLSADNLSLGKSFFEKHGNKSVFLGRFIGPLRPLVPFIAGIVRMRMRTFFFWNALSAIVWSVTFILVGYFFGHAWRAIGAWYGRIGAIAVILVVIGMVVAYRRARYRQVLKRIDDERAARGVDLRD